MTSGNEKNIIVIEEYNDVDDLNDLVHWMPPLSTGEWGLLIGSLKAHENNYNFQKKNNMPLSSDQITFFEKVAKLRAKLMLNISRKAKRRQ